MAMSHNATPPMACISVSVIVALKPMETRDLAKKDMNRNPEGKGGFQERPQDRAQGTWKKENTISYQYNRFINMTPTELRAFAKLPEDQKTMAMVLAFQRVLAANKSLPDLKEITDRTEGKSKEHINLSGELGITINTINYQDADSNDTPPL